MLKNAKSGSGLGNTEVDESHFERLENLILIHIDIKGKNNTICDSKTDCSKIDKFDLNFSIFYSFCIANLMI